MLPIRDLAEARALISVMVARERAPMTLVGPRVTTMRLRIDHLELRFRLHLLGGATPSVALTMRVVHVLLAAANALHRLAAPAPALLRHLAPPRSDRVSDRVTG
jgi:hypothetical protein